MRAFLFKLIGIDAAGLAAAWMVRTWIGAPAAWAVVIALVLTTANAAVGYHIIRRDFHKSFNTFLRNVFASLMLRMGALLAALAALVVWTPIPEFSFTIALFVAYICKSVLELIQITKLTSKRPD